MTDHKKKGDFDKARKHEVGGNKKAHMKGESRSRTGSKQNAGTADARSGFRAPVATRPLVVTAVSRP